MDSQTPVADGPVDTIVVGGGLAGLTAAALVARAGRSVVVLERAGGLGGRAATHVRDGINFNLGAHALYCHGHAFPLLTGLRVPFTGRVPSPGRSFLVDGAAAHPTPSGGRGSSPTRARPSGSPRRSQRRVRPGI
ncbi:MAG: crtN [Gemmataceae bacterium]|nr:crtN [Gemmataceae bacterium]